MVGDWVKGRKTLLNRRSKPLYKGMKDQVCMHGDEWGRRWTFQSLPLHREDRGGDGDEYRSIRTPRKKAGLEIKFLIRAPDGDQSSQSSKLRIHMRGASIQSTT